MPAPTAPAPSTDSLVQLVQAGLPAGAFEGVVALPLAVPAGQPPLWAVYSVGMRNFDLMPLPNHFVAIYTQTNANLAGAGAPGILVRRPDGRGA